MSAPHENFENMVRDADRLRDEAARLSERISGLHHADTGASRRGLAGETVAFDAAVDALAEVNQHLSRVLAVLTVERGRPREDAGRGMAEGGQVWFSAEEIVGGGADDELLVGLAREIVGDLPFPEAVTALNRTAGELDRTNPVQWQDYVDGRTYTLRPRADWAAALRRIDLG